MSHYAHTEEVRRLRRELVAREQTLAAEHAHNRMLREQLAQLARSAADAGLRVEPPSLVDMDGPSDGGAVVVVHARRASAGLAKARS